MKNKITILIITSILALISLSGIQAYLINNTYQLKKDAFVKETDSIIGGVVNHKSLESLFDQWSEDLKIHLSDYKNNRISKKNVIQRFQETADSLNTSHKNIFKEELAKKNLSYEVEFKTNIRSIIILNNQENDTIFSGKDKAFSRLFGDDFKEKETYVINTSRWFDELDYIDQLSENIRMNTIGIEVKTTNLIQIKNWKHIVYGRMALLFFGSVLLFLFVIGLLYYSIKNLVTQKKIAEIKTDFINNITHELKTPLATLSIATKSLKNEAVKNNADAFDNTINIVNRQNQRLQKLIDQVMDNSLSSEAIVLNKEQVVDNVYFNNLIEDFRLSTQHNALTIKNEVSSKEILLRLDKFHFATAILNIMENAVKYGKEQTEITFKTSIKNGDYVIKIQDNGIGISEKDQKQIFEKFYRVNDGNLHNVKGLGLGLYYTNQIIQAHNGTISIKSDLNKGTSFNIKIPMN